jgi:hypothetical protein
MKKTEPNGQKPAAVPVTALVTAPAPDAAGRLSQQGRWGRQGNVTEQGVRSQRPPLLDQVRAGAGAVVACWAGVRIRGSALPWEGLLGDLVACRWWGRGDWGPAGRATCTAVHGARPAIASPRPLFFCPVPDGRAGLTGRAGGDTSWPTTPAHLLHLQETEERG